MNVYYCLGGETIIRLKNNSILLIMLITVVLAFSGMASAHPGHGTEYPEEIPIEVTDDDSDSKTTSNDNSKNSNSNDKSKTTTSGGSNSAGSESSSNQAESNVDNGENGENTVDGEVNGSENVSSSSSSESSSFPAVGAAFVVGIGAIVGGGYLFREKIFNR